jgi:hypothetical protein
MTPTCRSDQWHCTGTAADHCANGAGQASSGPPIKTRPRSQICALAHNRQHQASFTTMGHDWQTIRPPLSAFRASFRGRDMPGAPALDPASIRQVGLLIAGRQAGPFALDIRRIGLA